MTLYQLTFLSCTPYCTVSHRDPYCGSQHWNHSNLLALSSEVCCQTVVWVYLCRWVHGSCVWSDCVQLYILHWICRLPTRLTVSHLNNAREVLHSRERISHNRGSNQDWRLYHHFVQSLEALQHACSTLVAST